MSVLTIESTDDLIPKIIDWLAKQSIESNTTKIMISDTCPHKKLDALEDENRRLRKQINDIAKNFPKLT